MPDLFINKLLNIWKACHLKSQHGRKKVAYVFIVYSCREHLKFRTLQNFAEL